MQESEFKTLLVEDNADFRGYVRQMLSDRFPAMQVAEAGSCQEAMDILDRVAYDLIFMDIKLPDGIGLDLTRVIKDRNAHSVVVILTSSDMPEYRQASLSAGANYFLTKGGSSCREVIRMTENFLLEKMGLNTLGCQH
jgi:CheY-like chemotaxis protein